MAEAKMIRVSVAVLAAMTIIGSAVVALAGDAEDCANTKVKRC
jgi:hypothetical protein